MGLFLKQIYQFLATSPGNFIYHIVLALCVAVVFQAAVHARQAGGVPQTRRMVIGLSILLGCQVLLFFFGFLTWMGWLGEIQLLPALDRAVSLLSLVWLAWLWAFPEPSKPADLSAFLLSLLVIFLFILTGIFPGKGLEAGFNLSVWETVWQICSLGIAILGILLLALQRPIGWGNGLFVFILAFLGHLVTLIWRLEGDYPGFLRFAHLAMFPLLFTLIQHYPAGVKLGVNKKLVSEMEGNVPVWEERRQYSADANTFQTLLKLAGESSIEDICPTLVRGVAESMLADICSFIVMGENDRLVFPCTFDLVHDKFLDVVNVEKESVPVLDKAFLRSQPLMMPASDTSLDISSLCQAFELKNTGSLLYVPIPAPRHNPIGGILLLSPYSGREWTEDDQEYLLKASVSFQPLLERGDKFSALTKERDEARGELQTVQEELKGISRLDQPAGDNQPGETEYQAGMQTEKLASMTAMRDEAQKKIEQLYNDLEQLRLENEELRIMGVPVQADTGKLETDLRQALEDVAKLQNTLVEANQRINGLEAQPAQAFNGEKLEVLSRITRDMVEPMTSIVDYTDLLLGESIGTLGPLQKKYMDKVKISTEIIGNLVNDLVQITNIDTGRMDFQPELIELNLVVDNAMGYTGTQLREKNITLRLDIPEVPSHIMIDGEALQQILIHLMQNATAASPEEGVVTLRMQVNEEEGNPQLLIQVTDSGEGIAPGNIPLAFTRRYGAEQANIAGVGDTGVGLSIVKTLVEAQQGQIWVDSQEKCGSTFNVILPIQQTGMEK
jgi:signal transduction histidine kinase